MSKRKYLLAAGLVAALGIPLAWAAGNWSTLPIVGGSSFCASTVTGTGGLGGITGQGQGSTGSICAQTIPAGPPFLTGNELVPADTLIGGGASPQTVVIPLPMFGNYWGTPRNFLDNGALNITNTNGTATVTCAVNAAIAVANMSADRWGCQANVGSGAGRTAIVTASPSPPAGFTNSMKVFRTSGALTQPICVMQEVTTPQSIQLAGQVVTYSFNAAALAGLAADNNNVINAVIFTGTGTDQLLTTAPTASPAITPAWTGIATTLNQAITITTTFTRYAVSATIPTTATEIGVALCFTPTATGAGATDGFAFTGAQLERSPGATSFEYRSKTEELAKAQAFFYSIAEGAGPTPRALCTETTANSVAQCLINYPVTMYLAPTLTFANGFAMPTTTAQTALANCSGFAADATEGALVQSVNATLAQCTQSGTTAAVGISLPLFDNGGTGSFKAWAGL
jgi:hypothetical protein